MSAPNTARRLTVVASLFLLAACQDTAGPNEPTPNLAMSSQAQGRLEALFQAASPAVLALPGTIFADNDEANGRLLFAIENEAVRPAVERALGRLGISDGEYAIEVREPIRQMATLRDVFRPTIAGIQIHFGNYVCTMGFNVSHSGGRSFITNSHCTNTQGGVEGTVYYQPSSSVSGVIATEVDDPLYFKGGVCPRGKKCRYSDASRALYDGATASNQGDIAKTTGANNSSLTTSGIFTINAQDNNNAVTVGTTVNKVGRTTGWSQGKVTNTCVNTGVQGSQIMQLCQTFVSAAVDGGDSGSPVFRILTGDSVELVGILWGGSSSSFVYSPLKNIQQELGAVTATK